MSESSQELKRGFEMKSSIPVLRMIDEAEARAFYLDYLGFEVDSKENQSIQKASR